jgi:molecular chaperone GrpE
MKREGDCAMNNTNRGSPNPSSADPTSKADNGDPLSGEKGFTAALAEIEALRERSQALEKERDEFRDLLQRSRADFENYQKRAQRDMAQERRYAHASLARELLPMFDNFERTMDAAKQAGEKGPLVQGVAMVQGQILDALRRHGITRIEAQGQPFDPNLHEAVTQQPVKDQPPNTVLQVLEHGFMIHDRVLRPARVIVGVAPPATSH